MPKKLVKNPKMAPCPEFEYAHHAKSAAVVKTAATRFMVGLRDGPLEPLSVAQDTRPTHRDFFAGLTPTGHEYYAGHYRGEAFACLTTYRVMVSGDPRVGLDPSKVVGAMNALAHQLSLTCAQLDTFHSANGTTAEKLTVTVLAACHAFDSMLQIHPYANGNGHMARVVIWAMLARYNYWPLAWSIEPRPPDPPYTQLLLKFRAGDRDPLVQHILQQLIPISRPPSS